MKLRVVASHLASHLKFFAFKKISKANKDYCDFFENEKIQLLAIWARQSRNLIRDRYI